MEWLHLMRSKIGRWHNEPVIILQILFFSLFFLISMKVDQGNQITVNGVLVNGNDVMIHTFLNCCVSQKVHKQAKLGAFAIS